MCPMCWLTGWLACWATWLGLGGLVAIIGRGAVALAARAGGLAAHAGAGATGGGWPEAVIENAHLRCAFLPGKGGEMISLVDRRTGHELLGRLRPTPPDDGSLAVALPAVTEETFNRWYAGGWQELLPNGDAPCEVDGVCHSFHGESWGRPWRIVRQTATSLSFEVDLSWPPLRLERTVTLDDTAAGLVIEERLTNTGAATARILWGHHPVFGGPLLAAGGRIIAPAGTMETVQCDATSRLEAAAGLSWPHGRGVGGRDVDVSLVQPRERRSHDLCLLTGFREGYVGLENPALGLRVMMEFDPALFRWLWIWQLYGGGEAEPFAGGYVVGLEPWTGPPQLSRGIAAGHALELEPGTTRETSLRLRVSEA